MDNEELKMKNESRATTAVQDTKEFRIVDSPQLNYARNPGKSFRGNDSFSFDYQHNSIVRIDRLNDKYLEVMVLSPGSGEWGFKIKAKGGLGCEQLNVIEMNSEIMKGKTYSELLNHKFSFSQVKV